MKLSRGLLRRLSVRAPGIEESIECHTRLSREHLTPELQLRLLTPDCPLYAAKDADKVAHFEDPFWAIYWPGGQALARYLLDEGHRLFGGAKGRVLDLGAGCGAAAIAAKMAGAEDALANDINEVACVAARMNARLNGVEIRTCTEDLIGRVPPPGPFDLLLVGDLLYDEATSARLAAWLDDVAGEAEVLLADPGRHGLTDQLRQRLVRLRTYTLTESGRRENHGYDSVTVWRYTPRKR